MAQVVFSTFFVLGQSVLTSEKEKNPARQRKKISKNPFCVKKFQKKDALIFYCELWKQIRREDKKVFKKTQEPTPPTTEPFESGLVSPTGRASEIIGRMQPQ